MGDNLKLTSPQSKIKFYKIQDNLKLSTLQSTVKCFKMGGNLKLNSALKWGYFGV